MENLDKMFETGLFINDLSMHDSSRDMVLSGTQQDAELKLFLDQVVPDAYNSNTATYRTEDVTPLGSR